MSELAAIPLARIRPNLNQVRRTCHRIDELARSIAQYGLLQTSWCVNCPRLATTRSSPVNADTERSLCSPKTVDSNRQRCVASSYRVMGLREHRRECGARRRSGLGSRAHLPQLPRVRPHSGRNRCARRQDAGPRLDRNDSRAKPRTGRRSATLPAAREHGPRTTLAPDAERSPRYSIPRARTTTFHDPSASHFASTQLEPG